MEFLKKYRAFLTISFLFLASFTSALTISMLNKPTQTRSLARAVTTPAQSANTSASIQSTESDLPQRSIYLGMWTEGFWDEGTFRLHPEKLTQLENTIGKKVAIAHYYQGWESLGDSSIVDKLNTISNYGWRPMISANPYFFSKCQANGSSLYKAIAQGNCDSLLQEIGRNIKAYNKPIFLRFAWEMNIESIEWSTVRTGDAPQDFVNAWRRFHDIALSEGASNIIWVFSPNTKTSGSTSYSLLYPGDAYVDWIGLDGYNWGTSRPGSKWQTFSEIFTLSYNDIVALAPSKPLMIAEVNTTDEGGNKAYWYQDMLTNQIPLHFPQVKAVVFYNEDRTKQESVNWLITISQSSLSSFSENIKNPIYVSSF